MGKHDSEFWGIVGASFPEYAEDIAEYDNQQKPLQREQEDETDDVNWGITAASYDHRIADYFLYGVGSEETLIAQLQLDYELTKEEVEQAIHKAMGSQQFGEITDYGDEE